MASDDDGRDRGRWPLPDDAYARAKHVLLNHQVRWDGSCFCGWRERGDSYAEHVLYEMHAAGVRLVVDDEAT